MLASDANGNFAQVLQPVPGTLQRLAPTSGNAVKSTVFSARAVAVAVRVRSTSGIGHVRLGDTNVAATIADLTLTNDDGWMPFSLQGRDADGVSFRAGFLSLFAEDATVNADIVELH